MKFLTKCKDGGPESTVTAYVLIEIKSLFSIMLLKFEGLSREAYHNHAFNCISWLFKGYLLENLIEKTIKSYKPSLIPIITKRDTFHKVDSVGNSWVLTFRGPWSKTWQEYLPLQNKDKTLSHGRVEV